MFLKKFILFLLPIFDKIFVILVYPSSLILWLVRRVGVHRLSWCKKVLLNVGVFPIRDYFYEPLFNEKHINESLLGENRFLPGIHWNIEEQLEVLKRLKFSQELDFIDSNSKNGREFALNNGAFEAGDAEFWYNLVRLKKPKKIIEIGSGHSTKLAIHAIDKNQSYDTAYQCDHICIEPFENPWLEEFPVQVIRKKLEHIDKGKFDELNDGDILFVDSSHVIRPQGDVVVEILEILPKLRSGVIVHFHDIFTPKDYPSDWITKEVRFWNEQYLLEAFLTSNSDWKIIGALNLLHCKYYNELQKVCPFLKKEMSPGSFYIQKIN